MLKKSDDKLKHKIYTNNFTWWTCNMYNEIDKKYTLGSSNH